MSFDQQYSNELLLYPMFFRKYVLRRISDFRTKHDLSSLVELPRQSVLHLFSDNFLMTKPIVFVPELDNEFLRKNPHLKYIHHVTQPVSGSIVTEGLRLPPQGVISTLMAFKRKTMQFMKPWENLEKMPGNVNSQAMICYNTLYRAKIFGLMKDVRRFNYIFSSVVNMINKMPDRINIVPIPVGSTQYSRSKYIPSFKAYTRTSIKAPTDPWYLFCMHLLGFMHSGTDSLLLKLSEKAIKNTIFILYNDREFVALSLDKLREFNQGSHDIVLLRTIDLLNSLAENGTELSYTDFGVVEPITVEEDATTKNLTEEDINKEEDPEKEVEVVKNKTMPSITTKEKIEGKIENEVVERPKIIPKSQDGKTLQQAKKLNALSQKKYHDQFVSRFKRMLIETHALDQFKAEQITNDKFITLIQKTINNIKEEDISEPIMKKEEISSKIENKPIKSIQKSKTVEEKNEETPEEVEEEIFPEIEDEIKPEYTSVQPKLVSNGTILMNAPAYTKKMDDKQRQEFDSKTTDYIDRGAFVEIEQHTELTKAQYVRAYKMSQMYKDIVINNNGKDVTVEELLNSTPNDTVSSNELSFLKGQIPDESMLKSSVANFDKEYIDKFFIKDLVMELASFNRVGMFLKDLKITDVSDSMNNMLEVRAKYEDIHHKDHTVRFTIPKIDERGYLYINGGLKILKKQRIALPICKVSPTRIALSSDYGKYLVERVTTVAHSFINHIDKIIKESEGTIKVTFGTAKLQPFIYPYEFTSIGKKYTDMIVTGEQDWYFFFNDSSGLVKYFESHGYSKEQIQDAVETANDVKGYLVGISGKKTLNYVYMKLDGSIVVYNSESGVQQKGLTFVDLLCELCNIRINNLSEWTEFKLLSKKIPTIFALCYRYGLSYMLNYTKCKYSIYERKGTFPRRQSDVVIKFRDKVLVIPRAPLCHSLLFAGLNNYDLTSVDMDEMDGKDIYFDLLQVKRISVHNLKGIDNFFDLFVDPITRDILFRIGEPTDAKDLLIRATALLTTEDCPPVAASTNHRFRSYERLNTAVYRTLSALYSSYRYRTIGTSNSFSIKNFEITNMIVDDQLLENVDQINPINDIKYREEYGHGGTGGRNSTDTFMIEDRRWPDDGAGIIGEASADNGKTGYVGTTSSNPTIDNIRGLTLNKKIDELEPSEILTCSSLLGPSVIQDDSKRISFLNIHLSHYVPTKDMSLPRVRTGYERVVAHRCNLPFTYAAEDNGVIESINTDSHMLIVFYPKLQKRIAIEYGDQYTNNGGGGFWCTQNIVINGFKEGDKVKKGDVIIYNEKFFKADPFNKQVDLLFGTLANVALIDNSTTVEDANIISNDLSKRLEFNPVHPRDIVITKKTNVHKFASIGTHLSNTDPLIIFDQAEITDNMFGKLDEETAVLLGDVNRQTPKAKFTGKIVRIDAYYTGTTEGMSESARKLVNYINKSKVEKYNIAKNTASKDKYYPATSVTNSTRIGKIVLDEETLIIRFYIQQETSMSSGDKVEFDSSLKSVCSGTSEEGWMTEDGSVKCDALFSTVGIFKRIVNSPFTTGIANRCLEKVEHDVLDMYFK